METKPLKTGMHEVGTVEGYIVMTSALYKPEVRDLCLNCPYSRCLDAARGCQAWRDAARRNARKKKR